MRAAVTAPRVWLIASAITVGGLMLLTVLVSRGSGGRPTCRQTMIPAYVPPAAITQLVDGAQHPRLLIVNPASGPGAEPRSGYRDAISAARKHGTRVLGYVPTGYGMREAAAVMTDIDRYKSWYGVNGIFLDEAAHDTAHLPYYQALSRHVRAGHGGLVALNPGIVPARGYFGLADVVVTFEGPAAAYAEAVRSTPDWVRRLPLNRTAHLVYAASRGQALAAAKAPPAAGWLYLTSGTPPDPWRTVPDYLNEEEAALRSCS
jgi:Spherulation-specific family 4